MSEEYRWTYESDIIYKLNNAKHYLKEEELYSEDELMEMKNKVLQKIRNIGIDELKELRKYPIQVFEQMLEEQYENKSEYPDFDILT